tara:strand:- start:427 stop:636 length:210 start_codon:yes stop_codon:yes gene_type:complete
MLFDFLLFPSSKRIGSDDDASLINIDERNDAEIPLLLLLLLLLSVKANDEKNFFFFFSPLLLLALLQRQ